MHFPRTLAFWVFGLASSVLVAADASTVVNDIKALGTALDALDVDIKAVVPGALGVAQALQVQVDAVAIHKTILLAIADANASAPFGTDSLSVSTAILQLQPKINTTLMDTTNARTSLGDLGAIVLASLYQLKQDTDAFGKAVIAKLEPLEAAIAPAIIQNIDASFNKAIVAYGGKGM